MNYLSQTCPIYTREVSKDWVETYQHDEVLWDDYSGRWCSPQGGHPLTETSERPAQWWCVAVYTSSSAYGGPEEGGWWYNTGSLVEHAKIKFFDNYQEACAYNQELWEWCEKEIEDGPYEVLVPFAFTEEMPFPYYPKTKPYYS